MKDVLSEIIEELRNEQDLSQTDLAVSAWPKKTRPGALMKYQRILNGQTVTVKDGSALAAALGTDLSKLLVLAEDRRRKRV